jgi:hypothetical protein
MRNIVLTDAEARDKATRHFFNGLCAKPATILSTHRLHYARDKFDPETHRFEQDSGSMLRTLNGALAARVRMMI